jgi:hypothetical protein
MTANFDKLDAPLGDKAPHEPNRSAHAVGDRIDGEQLPGRFAVMPSRRLPGWRKFRSQRFLGPASGFGQGVLPSKPVGDRVQKPPARWQVVLVLWLNLFPAVAGGVSCRKTEHLRQPSLPVAAVVGQRLTGPLAGHQHSPPGITEMVITVGLSLAPARNQAGPGGLGLDAVAQPIRARRRARLIPQRFGEPFHVLTLSVAVWLVAVPELLGQVLGQMADTTSRVLGPGEHALGVELCPEPDHVPRLIIITDRQAHSARWR